MTTKQPSKTSNCNIIHDKNFDIYCGRGRGEKNNPLSCKEGEYGWLGNPVVIGKPCRSCSKIHEYAIDTLECYREYLMNRLFEPNFYKEFLKLDGKKLGCFCKPDPCHTDVIIKVLEEIKENI
jgi:hypothetical protein